MDEFKQAVMNCCVGRKYEDFPQAMRAFIESNFRMIDLNSDGVLALEEYRYDCVQRMVLEDIKIIDEAFYSLLNVSYYLTKTKVHLRLRILKGSPKFVLGPLYTKSFINSIERHCRN